ncbi:MAG: dihydroorotate dehydrogenase electron transfer subunit [Thermoplasmatales archaeon]|nr:dihydroorotate dehydrogenase electron transfer subunit [Thermoplasmatales archaeon]
MNEVVRISSAEKLNSSTWVIRFKAAFDARPGQFVMVWAPGMDEIPLSLSSVGETKAVTFKVIGDDTRKLSAMSEGDRLHVRGPYGNGFDLSSRKVLLVGGGIGIAPLMPILEAKEADAVFAARDGDEVAYCVPIAEGLGRRHWVSTDDGSLGFKGNAVQLVTEVLGENVYDEIIACGPEIMLYYLHRLCVERGIRCQMSLERYMKCAAGICGSCMVDDRRVCADGPVFTGEQISELREFGKTARDASGAKKKL